VLSTPNASKATPNARNIEVDMDLNEHTDTELLRELINRKQVMPAPAHRTYAIPHQEVVVGIGANHVASITLDDESLEKLDLEAVEAGA
jgi:DNA-binding protein YbaB